MKRNHLKYIAVAAMLLDHISAFFIPITSPAGCVMRIIGRLTVPIMCYFLAEGFRHTTSHKKYGIRLFIFAAISQFPYAFVQGIPILTPMFNMIFTLFLCFLILLCYKKIENELLKITLIFALVLLSFFSDWGLIAPLWVLSFYIVNDDKKYRLFIFTAISTLHLLICTASAITNGDPWYAQMWQAGVFLFIPLMLLYNGKNGCKTLFSKWFFYMFYPAHLIAIGLIKKII